RFLIKAILDKKTAEVHISDLQKIDRPRGHIQYSEWLQILEEELKLRDPELTVDDSILQAREAFDTLLNGQQMCWGSPEMIVSTFVFLTLSCLWLLEILLVNVSFILQYCLREEISFLA